MVGVAGISCDYPFTLSHLPTESRYRVSVGKGATAWFTRRQMVGRITLRLGPVVRTPLSWLTGSDTVAGDGFGTSVAMSGAAIVVGSPSHTGGRVYVFTGAAGGWRQSAELVGSDVVRGDGFGSSVAVSGGTIVVGASRHANAGGRVYVFTRAPGGWRQSAELVGSDTVRGDGFGSRVAISGGTIVVGATGANPNSGGRAYAFSKAAGSWSQVAEMKGFDDLGGAVGVAVSSDTMVVGAFNRTSIYVETAGAWKLAATLNSPGAFVNAAISADTLVVSGQGPGCGTGRADLFTRTGHGWKPAAVLTGDGCFGLSVATSGSSVAVGGAAVPAVYLFTRTAGGWRQSAELTNYQSLGPTGFFTVAISGVAVVVGAPEAKPPGHRASGGVVYVFGP